MKTVVINSDRVHICVNDVPEETLLFKTYRSHAAEAIGIAVLKALDAKFLFAGTKMDVPQKKVIVKTA